MNLNVCSRLVRSTLARFASVLLLSTSLVMMSAAAIGASTQGCGTYSYGFSGTRLINDGISDSAGPFAIELPAGTYDIAMWSGDNHPTNDYQVEQTHEQWYFTLDSGYRSPVTADIPADGTATTTTVGGVTLEAATSISVHHVRIGGVNSVNVECIGFTPTVPAIRTTTTTTTTTTEVAKIAGPASTTTTTAAAVPVEVQEKVELPQTQLAITGPRNTPLLAAGAASLLLGMFCLALERRRA